MAGDEPGLKDSLLPYETWIQESLRGVMRLALERTAREGLPGDHHFFITFRTDHRGVRLPAWLKAQYPHEMTVVLQYQFEDLETDAEGFGVTLFFGGKPAHLVVPWQAVTQFADPAVRFGLRFEVPPPAEEPAAPPAEAAPAATVEPAGDAAADSPQVISLDAFRKRPPRG